MKKTLSFILAALMVFSTALTVYAADASGVSEENKLKQVLTAVKTAVDIPEEYTEFDYWLNTNYGKDSWQLNWHTEDYSSSIYISADGDGKIVSYRAYTDNDGTKAPVLLKDDALEKAKAILAEVYPDIVFGRDYELTGRYSNTYSGEYEFYFRRVVNGIPFESDSLGATVNYVTGEITGFSCNWSDVTFDDASNIITSAKAMEIWKSDIEPQLRYTLTADYDYETGKYGEVTAKLIYTDDKYHAPILAKTGEFLEDRYGWDARAANDYAAAEEAEAGYFDAAAGTAEKSVSFSEKEVENMEELDGFIKVEEADAAVRKYAALDLDSTYRISSSRIGTFWNSYSEEKKVWNLTYASEVTKGDLSVRTARATVDAVTGELLSFSNYIYRGEYDEDGNLIRPTLYTDNDGAKLIASEFLKKAAGAKFDQTQISNEYNSYLYGEKENYETSLSINYERVHEGVSLNENSLSVTVDLVTGKITNFYSNWTDGVTFEASEPAITADRAADIFLNGSDCDLVYTTYTVYLYDKESDEEPEGDGKYYASWYNSPEYRLETRLVYTLNTKFGCVSALTGEPLYWDGSIYEPCEDVPFEGYADISGHWAENTIKLLSDIGVLPTDATEFKPDEFITQQDFSIMLYAAYNGYPITKYGVYYGSNMYDVYNDLRWSGVYVPENDPDIVPEAPLMRRDAAKFIMRALGYEKVAALPGIFKVDFIDADTIPEEYLGYAALAKALGIIHGDNGCFYGSENITRAESAVLIYNFLCAR